MKDLAAPMFIKLVDKNHIVITTDLGMAYYLAPHELSPFHFRNAIFGMTKEPKSLTIAFGDTEYLNAMNQALNAGASPFIYPNREDAAAHLKTLGYDLYQAIPKDDFISEALKGAYKQEHKTPYPEEPDTEDMQCDECDCDIFTALINSQTKELYALECQGCGHLNLLVNIGEE